jgi:hypothetical protein
MRVPIDPATWAVVVIGFLGLLAIAAWMAAPYIRKRRERARLRRRNY